MAGPAVCFLNPRFRKGFASLRWTGSIAQQAEKTVSNFNSCLILLIFLLLCLFSLVFFLVFFFFGRPFFSSFPDFLLSLPAGLHFFHLFRSCGDIFSCWSISITLWIPG